MNNSANKVVVITGASSGIGEAIALHLANKPFSLVLVARRLDRINALVDRIIQQGGNDCREGGRDPTGGGSARD
jgi:NADP-dependent 3-hydroxy acid dehydrogenase YdfG